MEDQIKKEEVKAEQPILKPYTLDNLRRRKEGDQRRIKELMQEPEIKVLDQLPIRREDIEEAKIKLARHLISRERSTERWKGKAGIDSLTGIPNRRAFNERLAYELARSIKDRKSFALIYFDLDHFKQVNDALGHAIGDKVLVELGKTLAGKEKINEEQDRPVLRAIETPARIGGEEFAIILPETDEKNAKSQADRIKQVLEQRLTQIDEVASKGIKITTSFGITIYEPHTKYDPKAKQPESVQKAAARIQEEADAAQYQAKNQGRNRIVVYTPAPGA